MPSAYNEVVVMVNKDNEISDYSLYCMGLMDSDELVSAVKSAMSNNNERSTSQANYRPTPTMNFSDLNSDL